MPVLEDVTCELSNAKVYSTFDAKDGYWQIELAEKSSDLTTFSTPFGRYKWLRLPFGVCVASEEFQKRLIDKLEGLNGVYVIADDILVVGKGDDLNSAIKDHDKNVINLFERLKNSGIKINKTKI